MHFILKNIFGVAIDATIDKALGINELPTSRSHYCEQCNLETQQELKKIDDLLVQQEIQAPVHRLLLQLQLKNFLQRYLG